MSDTATLDKSKTAPLQEAPEPKLPALRGGGSMHAIIPQNFEEAYKMARIIVAAGTAPKAYEMKDPTNLKPYVSVERVAVAIMHGLEVGLPPMQAVQGIAVINGMPTVWGDARDGLVAASGLLEDMKEEIEIGEDGVFNWARCTVWRKGRKSPIEYTLFRTDAARAGWLKKDGPWQSDTNQMAQTRARGRANRRAFPDVLKGLADHDEVLDMPPVDVTDRGSATTAPPPPSRSQFTPAAATDVSDQAATEPDKWELFDEVGELVGNYAVTDWLREFSGILVVATKAGAKERAQALENNADNAKAVWESIEDAKLAENLRALYERTEPGPTAKNWSIPDNIVGQEKKLLAIYAMLDGKGGGSKVETPAEVDQLWAAHEAFFDKLGDVKKSAANHRFGDRKIALAQAEQAGK